MSPLSSCTEQWETRLLALISRKLCRTLLHGSDVTQVKNFNTFLFKNLRDFALTLVNERQIRAWVNEWPCYPAQVFFIKPGLSESCISYLFDSFTYFLQTFFQKRFRRASRRSIFKPYTLGNVVCIALLNVSAGTAHTFLTNKIELSQFPLKLLKVLGFLSPCGVNIIERKTSWARGSAHFLSSLCKIIRGVKTEGFFGRHSPSCVKKLNNFKTVQVMTTKLGSFS